MALVKYVDGVSRFDIAICLRLLERKFLRVESGLYIEEEADLRALGDISLCWDDEIGAEENRTREAEFTIRIDATPVDWCDTDEYEGCLLHELVHVAQLERRGPTRSSATFSSEYGDEDGALDRDASIAYYSLFPYEREAKAQEVRMVLGPANRDYWRGILAGSAVG